MIVVKCLQLSLSVLLILPGDSVTLWGRLVATVSTF